MAGRVTAHLADDGVVGGGDGVEDSLDALQLLLVASGDAVEGFVVVLQGATALAAKDTSGVSAGRWMQDAGRAGSDALTCLWGPPPPCIASS